MNLSSAHESKNVERRNDAQQRGTARFCPTIIVGLGGTGIRVLTELKALLLDTFDDNIPGHINLLGIDTDDHMPEVRRGTGLFSSLNRGTEFIHVEVVPVRGVLEHLHQFSEIQKWFPKDFRTINQTSQ